MQRDIDLRKTQRIYIDMEELPNNCIIIISDNNMITRNLPEYGEFKVVSHNGKIKRIVKTDSELIL